MIFLLHFYFKKQIITNACTNFKNFELHMLEFSIYDIHLQLNAYLVI